MNPNELVVTGTARTNTWFASLFGLDPFNVSAHANACSPCSSTPVDIVVAIDRTGSMCDQTDRHDCIDPNNAKDGVRTMLGLLSPPYARIGMVAFPPCKRRRPTRARRHTATTRRYDRCGHGTQE